ncbi:MAG: hypothetical protein LC135_02640 [Phycisphaerae bacterium]|nr:hypothetical protein [Phycisphaerae bacterium]MCZ2398752.1 hypothetical protein [Phycisphaerae bacterium]
MGRRWAGGRVARRPDQGRGVGVAQFNASWGVADAKSVTLPEVPLEEGV